MDGMVALLIGNPCVPRSGCGVVLFLLCKCIPYPILYRPISLPMLFYPENRKSDAKMRVILFQMTM